MGYKFLLYFKIVHTKSFKLADVILTAN